MIYRKGIGARQSGRARLALLIFGIALGLSRFLLGGFVCSEKFVRVFFPDGSAVTAELARTPEERARGLMFRKSLSSEEGMLFVFEKEGFYSFWMKNMLLPLDILWLDRERRIVHIEQSVPPCREEPCPTYVSRSPARYVLELKAGLVREKRLKLFDRLDFSVPRIP
ncbi:MAG: DUF192 domain-containing protein [Candidatus Aminicenantales bacterium]